MSKHDHHAMRAKSWNAARSVADRRAYRAIMRQFNSDVHNASDPTNLMIRQRAYLDALRQQGNKAASFPSFIDWEAAQGIIILVREFSAAGPCLTIGRLVGETPKFYIYLPWRGGHGADASFRTEQRRIAKHTENRYSSAHIVPCKSCQDHAETQYPHGYMD